MAKPVDDRNSLKELQKIPGIGPSIARDLLALNIRRPADLVGKDPEKLYARFNRLSGRKNDPCLLYAFRCAVYAASSRKPAPRLLKWWNWKDSGKPGRSS